jgi:formate hydrogenlyase subunit 3/multisubunit Na+/H+ antiporter MnhD subunit
MTGSDLAHILQSLILSMVAGTPLLLAILCGTSIGKKAHQIFPWTVVPALITISCVPLDSVVEVPWFFMGGRMGLDETGRIFLCVAAFIWLLSGMSAAKYLADDHHRPRFYGFFLSSMAGNFGLILAQDMLGFYLFFALMSFSAYGLVVHHRTDETRKAGLTYLGLVMIGEIAIFISLLILSDSARGSAMEDLSTIAIPLAAIILLFIGFGVKIGAIPFHVWMPSAYQAAPIPAAAALAGAMVNAGLLGWLRFLPLGNRVHPEGAKLFIFMGTFATFYGVIIGLDKKKAGAVLACSSISQMGLMTVIFGLGLTGVETGQQAATCLIMYAVHHSLAKSSLFLGYGAVVFHSKKLSHWHLAGLLLPSLALAGLPLTSGAIAKTGFKELAASIGEPWSSLTLFLPLSAIGTTMLVLHFIQIVRKTSHEETASPASFPSVWVISLAAVALSLWLWPLSKTYGLHTLSGDKLWQGLWPVVVGCLLSWLWYRTYARKKLTEISARSKRFTFDYLRDKIYWPDFIPRKGKSLLTLDEWFPFSQFSRVNIIFYKTEKILGRWTVVGLFYLIICIILMVSY